MKRILAAAVGLLLLSGCATIMNGSKQTVSFMSEPSGAQVSVGGEFTGSTPMAIPLKRNQDYIVIFKKEGYQTQQLVIKSEFDHWIASTLGNIWNYIIPGLIVDATSGGAYTLDKSLINAVLVKGPDPIAEQKTPQVPVSQKKESIAPVPPMPGIKP